MSGLDNELNGSAIFTGEIDLIGSGSDSAIATHLPFAQKLPGVGNNRHSANRLKVVQGNFQ